MLKLRSWMAALANGLFAVTLGSTSLPGDSAPVSSPPSIPIRVAAVRSALADKLASDLSVTLPVPDDSAGHQVAQWGNWLNWGNWGNWANWANWGNWANWRNF